MYLAPNVLRDGILMSFNEVLGLAFRADSFTMLMIESKEIGQKRMTG